MPSLGCLFFRMLQLGAVAYGSLGMIGQLKETFVDRYGWVKEEEFLRGLALCQSLPGATTVQIVTYVGYQLRGLPGALAAAVAFVLPAFIALLALSALYFRVQSFWYMQAFFQGVGAIVTAVILNTCLAFGQSVFRDWKVVLISVLSFVAFFWKGNFVLIFLLAAAAGLVLRPKLPETKAPLPGSISVERAKEKNYPLLILLAAILGLLLALSYLLDPKSTVLCLHLAKIGALAFGGGFSAIPLIQYEMVDRLHWLSTKEFVDGIALGQITPGPVLITATFVGYKVAHLWGAFMATLGVFSPPFFILIILIPYHERLKDSARVRLMEQGILSAFIGMLALVLYNFAGTSLLDAPSVLMAAAAFLALHKKIPLPYVLLVGGLLSIILRGFVK